MDPTEGLGVRSLMGYGVTEHYLRRLLFILFIYDLI